MITSDIINHFQITLFAETAKGLKNMVQTLYSLLLLIFTIVLYLGHLLHPLIIYFVFSAFENSGKRKQWQKELGPKNIVDEVIIEFSKEFDCIHHNLHY